MKRQEQMILTARIVSMLFTPFYLPILGLATLFMFSYLSMFPLIYKIQVLALTYLFTILLPTLLIHLYRRYQGWNLIELGQRERRMVPYIISITCYFTCIYVMERLHMPHFMGTIVSAALAIQIVCALVNVWWKISTHTAAIGGTIGAVMAFAFIFGFNPLWWICALMFLAGVVGTSRTLLRLHTLGEVTGGFLVGLFAGFLAVIFT